MTEINTNVYESEVDPGKAGTPHAQRFDSQHVGKIQKIQMSCMVLQGIVQTEVSYFDRVPAAAAMEAANATTVLAGYEKTFAPVLGRAIPLACDDSFMCH